MNLFCDSYMGSDIDDDDKPETAPQGGETPKPEIIKPGIQPKLHPAPQHPGPGGF